MNNNAALTLMRKGMVSEFIKEMNSDYSTFSKMIVPKQLVCDQINIKNNIRSTHHIKLLAFYIDSLLLSKYELTSDNYYEIMKNYRLINDIRYINSPNSVILDFLINALIEDPSPSNAYKASVAYDIYESNIEPEFILDRLPAADKGVAIFMMLTARGGYTKVASRRREILYSYVSNKNFQPHKSLIVPMSLAYMYVTYTGNIELERGVKRVVSEIYEAINLGIKTNIVPRPKIKNSNITKRKLLVVAELWGENHPMQKCYKFIIQELRKHFTVGLVATKQTISLTNSTEFDYFIEADSANHLRNISLVENESPDVIYYPSVGMAAWVMLLAARRIAKRQICSGGHPSNPYMSTLDLMMVDEITFSTKYPSDGVPIKLISGSHDVDEPEPKLINKSKVKIKEKISINAMVAKLSDQFLVFLDELVKRKKVILHFHIAENGINMYRLADNLKSRYENCIVDGYVNYETYIHRLSSSILSIPTFPFGHANSIVDSLTVDVLPLTYISNIYGSRSALTVLKLDKIDNIIAFDDLNRMLEQVVYLIDNINEAEILINKIRKSREIKNEKFAIDFASEITKMI